MALTTTLRRFVRRAIDALSASPPAGFVATAPAPDATPDLEPTPLRFPRLHGVFAVERNVVSAVIINGKVFELLPDPEGKILRNVDSKLPFTLANDRAHDRPAPETIRSAAHHAVACEGSEDPDCCGRPDPEPEPGAVAYLHREGEPVYVRDREEISAQAWEAAERFRITLSPEQQRLYLQVDALDGELEVFDKYTALAQLGRHFDLPPALVEMVSEHVSHVSAAKAATCCRGALDPASPSAGRAAATEAYVAARDRSYAADDALRASLKRAFGGSVPAEVTACLYEASEAMTGERIAWEDYFVAELSRHFPRYAALYRLLAVHFVEYAGDREDWCPPRPPAA